MESEATYAGLEITAGNWQDLRDSRERLAEHGIEASDLDCIGQALMEGFNQSDLARQVCQIQRLRPAQFLLDDDFLFISSYFSLLLAPRATVAPGARVACGAMVAWDAAVAGCATVASGAKLVAGSGTM